MLVATTAKPSFAVRFLTPARQSELSCADAPTFRETASTCRHMLLIQSFKSAPLALLWISNLLCVCTRLGLTPWYDLTFAIMAIALAPLTSTPLSLNTLARPAVFAELPAPGLQSHYLGSTHFGCTHRGAILQGATSPQLQARPNQPERTSRRGLLRCDGLSFPAACAQGSWGNILLS